MKVRRIESQEIAKILAWLPSLRGPAFNWTAETLEAELRFAEGWGLEIQGEFIAFVCERQLPDATEWTVLATHPEHFGNGHMKSLLSERLRAAKQNFQVWLEVHEKNLAAVNLYRKLGFAQSGSRARYYSDGGSALLFTKRT